MLNKVTLIGRLGADPESKTMDSGTEVVNLGWQLPIAIEIKTPIRK